MLKVLVVSASAVTLAVGHVTHDPDRSIAAVAHVSAADASAANAPPAQDVSELLDASRGVDPVICWLAAEGLSSGFSGRMMGLPHPPVGRDAVQRASAAVRDTLGERGRARVRQAMRSADACERELATRLVGREGAREFDSAELHELLADLFADQLAPGRISAAVVAGLTRAKDVVDAVHIALTDADVQLRANSAWALGRIRDADSARPLTRALGDGDQYVRAAAIVALSRIASDDTVLLRILRDDRSAEVRRTAAWALQRSRTSDAIAGLTAALRSDPDEEVREMAAWALGSSRSANAADALAQAVQGDRSLSVRATAAWGVGNITPRRIPAGLLAGLTDEAREVRLRAAWAAGQIRDPDSAEAVQRALGNERDERVRSAMVRALVLSGERDARALESLLQSEDDDIRRRAVMMLAGRSAPWPWPWPQPRPYP